MLIAVAMLIACLACGYAGYWLGRLDGDSVGAYADGFEAAMQPCRLNPIHGALPEPEIYTEHSPQIVRGGQYVDGYGA